MESTKHIEIFLNGKEVKLSSQISGYGHGSHRPSYHLLPRSARTISEAVEASLKVSLDAVPMEELVNRVTNWWQRTWRTREGRSAGVEALIPTLGDELEKALKNFLEQAERDMKEQGVRALSSMVDSSRVINDRIIKRVDDLKRFSQLGKTERAQISTQLEVKKRELGQVSEIRAAYKESVGG